MLSGTNTAVVPHLSDFPKVLNPFLVELILIAGGPEAGRSWRWLNWHWTYRETNVSSHFWCKVWYMEEILEVGLHSAYFHNHQATVCFSIYSVDSLIIWLINPSAASCRFVDWLFFRLEILVSSSSYWFIHRMINQESQLIDQCICPFCMNSIVSCLLIDWKAETRNIMRHMIQITRGANHLVILLQVVLVLMLVFCWWRNYIRLCMDLIDQYIDVGLRDLCRSYNVPPKVMQRVRVSAYSAVNTCNTTILTRGKSFDSSRKMMLRIGRILIHCLWSLPTKI